MYHRTLVNSEGFPSSISQNKVTFRRSISLTGEGGSILNKTFGLSVRREIVEYRNESLMIDRDHWSGQFLAVRND